MGRRLRTLQRTLGLKLEVEDRRSPRARNELEHVDRVLAEYHDPARQGVLPTLGAPLVFAKARTATPACLSEREPTGPRLCVRSGRKARAKPRLDVAPPLREDRH